MEHSVERGLPVLVVLAIVLLLGGCRNGGCCPSRPTHFKPGRESVALVQGGDKLTLLHLSNVLGAAGIEYGGGGSFSYGLTVSPSDVPRAKAVLVRDGALRGYVIESTGLDEEKYRSGKWTRVELGARPHTIPSLVSRFSGDPAIGPALESEDLREVTDRGGLPVVITGIGRIDRAFMLGDGTWGEAHEVKVEFSVDGGQRETQILQLIPRPDGTFWAVGW